MIRFGLRYLSQSFKFFLKNYYKMDKYLLFIPFILFVFGSFMILSASNIITYYKVVEPYYYFLRQFLFIISGSLLFILLLPIFVKYEKLDNLIKNILFLFIIILCMLLIYGVATNSSKSWFYIGPFGIQPSEFVKIVLILYMARYYATNKITKFKHLIPLICIVLGIFILIYLQPDLGTGLLILALSYAMFLVSEIPPKFKLWSIFSVLSLIILVYFGIYTGTIDYKRISRLDFLNPCSSEKYYNQGYQVCNGYIAISNGEFFGVGPGNSTQKYLYLPAAHTDFIFAIIVEEWGFLGGIILLLFYTIIIIRGFKISLESTNISSRLIVMGAISLILFNIVINIGGLLGMMPLTGIPLPFLSYGGSFTWVLFIALSLIQAVVIKNYKEKMLTIK